MKQREPRFNLEFRSMAASSFRILTGHSPSDWFHFIQKSIRDASTPPPKGENHGRTDGTKWMAAVLARIWRGFPRTGGPYDGNMRVAAQLSLVLAHWYLRVHRAKAMDPKRPIAHRKAAYEAWLEYAMTLQSLAVDERGDPGFFPGQVWENPWHPKARNGRYV